MNSRTGVDGRRYAIDSRLRLPTMWNGRLYMGGAAASAPPSSTR